ncbi:MAG: hypothetical protein OK422_04675 [Thaumarchaeota archaeon]|nr:hypothetical protein [Nitrososphaerota archaeon]
MSPMLEMAIIFSALNAGIALVLLFIYGKIALRTRAAYSVGLVVFSLLFFVQTASTAFGYYTLAEFFSDGAYPFMALVAGLELAGLLVLARITL